MSTLAHIDANGVQFGYLSQGEGPLVLCIHGFPDTPHTWGDLMERLSGEGYRVVAPFTRGYAPSGIPENNRFTMEDFGRDTLALINALGEERAYLVGHDWGASAVYAASVLAPEKVIKAVTAAVPHPNALKFSGAQLRKSWYMFFFQLRGISERRVKKNNYALIKKLWRDWSPGLSANESVAYIEAVSEALDEDAHLSAALGYYRELFTPAKMKRNQAFFSQPIAVPTLTIAGADDGCIGPEHFPGMASYFSAGLEVEILAGAGHFMHLEQPDIFASKVLNFFQQE